MLAKTNADPTDQEEEGPDGFAVIYDRYVERIYRFIYSRTHDRALAEEITEDVFFKALKHIGTYRERGCGIGPWLYRIAGNAIADHYRRRVRAVALESPLADPPSADDVQELVIKRDRVRRIWLAIDRLPRQQRKAMLLRFSGDLSTVDAARRMNKSADAVKLLVHRAVQRLRLELVPLEA